MLSWIPLVGPILQGLFSTVSSIYTTFANEKITQINAEVTDAQTAQQTVNLSMADTSLVIMRDLALVGPVVWGALISWDTIMAFRYPWLRFHVADFPVSVKYIPYGAYTFLFGLLGFKIWKGKL